MSRHRRGRITVQSQPTGAAQGVRRGIGVVQAIFGFVFVVVAVTEIIPTAGLFGLPFLAIGGLFMVMGIIPAVSKNGMAQRVGYDVETGVEEETIVGLMDEVLEKHEGSAAAAPQSHDHIPSTALNAKERLEQLQSLKDGGLITQAEYDQKRQEILRNL